MGRVNHKITHPVTVHHEWPHTQTHEHTHRKHLISLSLPGKYISVIRVDFI